MKEMRTREWKETPIGFAARCPGVQGQDGGGVV